MSKTDDTRKPAECFCPGDFIQEEIAARGWTQEDFAAIIEKPLVSVNQIINGKRAIIPEVAKRIAAAFGNSAQFWMNLETNWQLYKDESSNEERIRNNAELYNLVPVREMCRRGWIQKAASPAELQARLETFFGDCEQLQAARMSAHNEKARAAVLAWCRRSVLVAQLLQVGKFVKSRVPNLMKRVRLLFTEPEEVRHVPQILAEFGIRLVIVQHLKGTHLDGASVSDSESNPVIALSLRYGRLDYFWYTLIHELAHIY